MVEESGDVMMRHRSPIVSERSSRSNIRTYCQQYYYPGTHIGIQRMWEQSSRNLFNQEMINIRIERARGSIE